MFSKFKSFSEKSKFSLHPMLILCVLTAIVFHKLILLLSALFVLSVHEFSHLIAAYKLGFRPDKFSVSPFGATLAFDCGLSDSDAFTVAAAGPLSNILLCPLIAALWWVYPSVYGFTYPVCKMSIGLALFNLLPIFPFDGGRMILSVCSNKLKSLKILKINGIAISVLLIALGIIGVFLKKGFGAFLAGVCILWSVLFDSENEKYKLILDNACSSKRLSKPYFKSDIYVNENVRLGILLKKLRKPDCLYTVHVMNNSMETVKTIEYENINFLFFKNRKLPVKRALYK